MLESSLFYAPLLLGWFWLVTKFGKWQQSIWMVLILGVVLDVSLVNPLGISSFVLLIAGLVFWFERQMFASSIKVDLAILLVTLTLWSWWRGQHVLLGLIIFFIAALGLKLFGVRDTGVVLRRHL